LLALDDRDVVHERADHLEAAPARISLGVLVGVPAPVVADGELEHAMADADADLECRALRRLGMLHCVRARLRAGQDDVRARLGRNVLPLQPATQLVPDEPQHDREPRQTERETAGVLTEDRAALAAQGPDDASGLKTCPVAEVTGVLAKRTRPRPRE